MRKNENYSDIIKTTLIGILIGGIIVYWGYSKNGVVRFIIGALIILTFIKNAIENIKYVKEIKLWWKENEGQLIFFYPTSKKIQERIELEVIPYLPNDCLKVYYNGPSLVGDIKRSIIVDLMNQYKLITVNSPSIFKIVNGRLYIESLSELLQIEKHTIDMNAVKTKIDQIARY